ncbi:lytic transglycosylase domain-containing protein [Coraliomargarita akajimensis]|uniref:Lytic transglycosylase catalytic n=1 Tax=Coraliomargarita akajimensis (strain DSM 45221 / IAM 15411 / JCM 23193 / KCTC 12865 / 04OKA010-24) TaxID=583355 RepID=D5EQ63_CORAD|nr:lytic transglycosylase domain-containing protein [Coraliomargarita akajimensis]ADE53831.1 Lytic transglycosylase catalytic [Coraliomargarita akajimensis DSM 45221]
MPDPHYHRDERLIVRLAVVLGVVVGLLTVFSTAKLSPMQQQVSAAEVWVHVEDLSTRSDLDPEFVYAIAWAESSLNPRARSSVARGIMQVSKAAWQQVTEESYRYAWDWRINVRVAVDYLDYLRDFLQDHDSFSYPLLAASYRFGPNYVAEKGFDMDAIETPKNQIYRRLFTGDIRPVELPIEHSVGE